MIEKKIKGHVIKPDGSKAAIKYSHKAPTNVMDARHMMRKPQCIEPVTVECVQFSRTVYRNMYDQEERDIERAVRVLSKYAP